MLLETGEFTASYKSWRSCQCLACITTAIITEPSHGCYCYHFDGPILSHRWQSALSSPWHLTLNTFLTLDGNFRYTIIVVKAEEGPGFQRPSPPSNFIGLVDHAHALCGQRRSLIRKLTVARMEKALRGTPELGSLNLTHKNLSASLFSSPLFLSSFYQSSFF